MIPGYASYSQPKLYGDIFGQKYNAHVALDDALVLTFIADAGANAISVLVAGTLADCCSLNFVIADAHVSDLVNLPVMFISRTISVVMPMASASNRFLDFAMFNFT
jgi:hypothetical protein